MTEYTNAFLYYRTIKPYIQLTTFIESLSRDSNKLLIESINEGINVIIEGAFLDKYKSDSTLMRYQKIPSLSILRNLVDSDKYDEIKNYIFMDIIQTVDSKYPNRSDDGEAEALYSKCIEYLANHPNIIKSYNPQYPLNNYVLKFIINPVITTIEKHKDSISGKEEAEVIKNRNNVIKNELKDESSDNDTQSNEFQDAISSSINMLINDMLDNDELPAPEESIKKLIELELENAYNSVRLKQLKKDRSSAIPNIQRAKSEEARLNAQDTVNVFTEEIEELESKMTPDHIRRNFGENVGIQPNTAKSIWNNYLEILRQEPTILNWLRGGKKL